MTEAPAVASANGSTGRPSSYGSIPHDEGHVEQDPSRRRVTRRSVLQSLLPILGDTSRASSSSARDHDNESNCHRDDKCDVRAYRGQSTVTSQVLVMAKNLTGASALFLSKGIAMYADTPNAAMSGCVLIALQGVLFAWFSVRIAAVCEWTRAATYAEAWSRTVGAGTSASSGMNMASIVAFMVSMITTLQPALAYLALAQIAVETFQPLLTSVSFVTLSDAQLLWILGIVVVLPLSMAKNLLALATHSAVGMIGMLYTAVAMLVRYADGSYTTRDGAYFNHFQEEEATIPTFGTSNQWFSWEVLPFFCIVFEGWVVHYNSPRYYTELRDASIKRFSDAVGYSFVLTACIYMTIAAVGYKTFGPNIREGYVLNNYAPQDPLMALSRLAVGASIVLTLPLLFVGVRDSFLDCMKISADVQTAAHVNALSIFLFLVLTVGSSMLMSSTLGVIKAATQGMLATLLVFWFPAIMHAKAVQQRHPAQGEITDDKNLVFNVLLTWALAVVGVALGISGVLVSGQMTAMDMDHA
mmetsp:Transcript_29310/g.63608  ORF Transcript_29310/g.63608 Transcript_29310/m.63608 type:complete len:527 (+) Transcript_29310:68-1648(+)